MADKPQIETTQSNELTSVLLWYLFEGEIYVSTGSFSGVFANSDKPFSLQKIFAVADTCTISVVVLCD